MFTIIIWIIIALIVYTFREFFIGVVIFIGAFMGIGALLFWWWFDDASLGANIGFCFAAFIGMRMVLEWFGYEYRNIFYHTYYLISIPFWLLNRIQLILTGPWRYVFKYVKVGDGSRKVLRPILYFVEIVLYIITTPLRLLNAILYNIFIYGMTELYDLICEVFLPNNRDEGKGSFFGWIIWFPLRLVKYPIYHGCLTLIEAAIWTVIDIIIPTITMYHGTSLEAAKAICGSASRNKSLWSNWLAGTFKASDSNNGWGGLGVYFSPSRKVVGWYSIRAGGHPVFIACRVSMGKILNYALAPLNVEANVGGGRQHSALNRYADQNGYTTAEWWNGNYWEYCMFDWQNRYNYPWRIRPIYVMNLRSGLAQHIDGGFRHWLFSKTVIDDIVKSYRFSLLVIIAIIIVAWGVFWMFSNYWKWESYIPSWPEPKVVEQSFVSEPIDEKAVDEKPYIEEQYVEEPVTEEHEVEELKMEEPVIGQSIVEEIIDDRQPTYNQSTTTPRTTTNTMSSHPQSNPPTPSGGTGFRLEKVDHIPNETNPPKSKTGFRLERVNPNQ